MTEKNFEPTPEESLLDRFKKFITKKPAAAALFGEFEGDEALTSRLVSQKNFLNGQKTAKALKFDIAAAYVKNQSISNLAASVTRGLIEQPENQFDLVLELNCRAEFISRHSDEILKLLHCELVEKPENELSKFLKENEKDLKRLEIS